MRRLLLLAMLALVAPTLSPGAARAFPLEVVESAREVFADALAFAGTESADDTDADSTADPGPFVREISAEAAEGGALATAGAAQDSNVGSGGVTASGSAGASASADPGADEEASAAGESSLRIVFRSPTGGPFRLEGLVTGSAVGEADGFASVQLTSLDPGADPLDLLFLADPGEALDFDESGVLVAGVEYELLALASALAGAGGPDAPGIAGGSFRVTLTPEPGTALLLAGGLAALAGRRRGA